MDSFEWSKIAGAVFAALLLIIVPKTLIEMRQSSHEGDKPGFVLPAPSSEAPAPAAPAAAPAAGAKTAAPAGAAPASPAAAPAGGGASKAGGFDAKAVVAMIGSANADGGKAGFSKCAACHSVDKGGPNKVGPNLWNLVGRKKASKEDFAGYSAGMKAKGGDWTLEELAAFIHSPAATVTGTKMIFPGIKDSAALADILAYVRTLSDSPAALPK